MFVVTDTQNQIDLGALGLHTVPGKARRNLVLSAIPGARGDMIISWLCCWYADVFFSGPIHSLQIDSITRKVNILHRDYWQTFGFMTDTDPEWISHVMRLDHAVNLDHGGFFPYMLTKTHADPALFLSMLPRDLLQSINLLDIMVDDDRSWMQCKWETFVKNALGDCCQRADAQASWSLDELDQKYQLYQHSIYDRPEFQNKLSCCEPNTVIYRVSYRELLTQDGCRVLADLFRLPLSDRATFHWNRLCQDATSKDHYQVMNRSYQRVDAASALIQ